MTNSDGIHPTWRITEPWPATLVAPLKCADPPEVDAFLASVANRISDVIEVLEIQPSPDDKHPWSVVVRLPGHAVPVLIACERTKRMDEVPADLVTGVRNSRWSIVVESLLEGGDPRIGWGRLAGVLASSEDAIAIIDATTGRWFDRAEIDGDLLTLELGPPEDVLWRVQAVSGHENLDEGTVWIYTRGLLRCGLPELEILELPGRHAAAGARLLDALAGLLLEDGAPPPEIPYPLGPDLRVVLVPWTEVIETLDPESLGTDEDRKELSQETPNPLRARRAAICDLEPRGSFRRVWRWPEAALETLAGLDVTLYRSDAATERSASIARRRWPEAVAAFESTIGRSGDESAPMLLAGVPVGLDAEGRTEHGWLQVEAIESDGGRGRLLRGTIDGRPAGMEVNFGVEQIDDWRLVRGPNSIGPEDSVELMTFLSGASR